MPRVCHACGVAPATDQRRPEPRGGASPHRASHRREVERSSRMEPGGACCLPRSHWPPRRRRYVPPGQQGDVAPSSKRADQVDERIGESPSPPRHPASRAHDLAGVPVVLIGAPSRSSTAARKSWSTSSSPSSWTIGRAPGQPIEHATKRRRSGAGVEAFTVGGRRSGRCPRMTVHPWRGVRAKVFPRIGGAGPLRLLIRKASASWSDR